MCNEKPHKLCIKFLIEKCLFESSRAQLLPSVSPALKALFILLQSLLECAAIGCATSGRLTVSPEKAKAAGAGLNAPENEIVLCFSLQDCSRRHCLLPTGKSLFILHKKA